MRFKRVSSEVCIAEERIVKIGREEVDALKRFLAEAPRGRTRLCAHRDVGEALHEMLIALRRGVYIRPHRHLGKNESFHIVEGLVDVVVLDEGGSISEVVTMGDYGSGRNFYYRLSNPCYHTLLIRSEVLVVHETTSGPFRKEDTEFAPWAPEETDFVAAQEFMSNLSRGVDRFGSESARRIE
jgi:cupin fold WbuC family metalloprotein